MQPVLSMRVRGPFAGTEITAKCIRHSKYSLDYKYQAAVKLGIIIHWN